MKLVGVTRVMGMASDFSHVPAGRLEHAAQRGSNVHQRCAMHARGLWAPPLDAEAEGYVISFRRWFNTYVDASKPVWVEVELICRAFGIIGHPDLIATLCGHSRPSVIDMKTPTAWMPAWRGQLAAYRHLAAQAGIETDAPYSLRLKPDGSAAIAHSYDLQPMDFQAFLNGLNFYRYFIQR